MVFISTLPSGIFSKAPLDGSMSKSFSLSIIKIIDTKVFAVTLGHHVVLIEIFTRWKLVIIHHTPHQFISPRRTKIYKKEGDHLSN